MLASMLLAALRPQALLAVTMLVIGMGTPSDAWALRCGSKLVLEGMTIGEVLARCGEPEAESRRSVLVSEVIPVFDRQRRVYRRDPRSGQLVTPGYGPVTREVEVIEYTYNFGPRRFMRLLEFHNGRLERIRELGYGYHPR
ncbi:MAG: DUF2845 domain-containing protein [Pseudomonadota bacterium]